MKVFIKTYGCQMNERDSEFISAEFELKGYEITYREKEADILIFNTCSVREQAERKAIGKVGILKRLKRENPDIIIGIIGCMAQLKGDELFKELPHIDFVIGTDQIGQITNIVDREVQKRERVLITEREKDLNQNLDLHLENGNKVSEYISVMRGCDMYCSYCIVPYVRGREKSRNKQEIFQEAKRLVDRGVKEIFLLGQNISAYGMDQNSNIVPQKSPFAELLRELHNIDNLKRIRFTSPHPYFFNNDLIDTISDLPKVCKGIHLPLQAGSDKILKKMNRRYTISEFMNVVNKLKKNIPDVRFSTDIIVAFPGETEYDFQQTRDVMNEVGFDNAYIFKYSPREGTPAAKLKDQIPTEVKEERNQILLSDLQERVKKHNKAMEQNTYKILIEGESKRNKDRWSGRTNNNKQTVFEPKSDTRIGDLKDIYIKSSTPMTLFGELV